MLRCLAVAAAVCVVPPLLAGWRSGVVHLSSGVASGHAYIWVEGDRLSWLPYALAFETLPDVVMLATPVWPPAWMAATAAAAPAAVSLDERSAAVGSHARPAGCPTTHRCNTSA